MSEDRPVAVMSQGSAWVPEPVTVSVPPSSGLRAAWMVAALVL